MRAWAWIRLLPRAVVLSLMVAVGVALVVMLIEWLVPYP